jgi:hypothetical protein
MDRLCSVNAPAQTMRIVVLVPCFNETTAIASVVADFRKALPSAESFVTTTHYSSDRTVAVAREAGAQVRSERRQGKGHVVRRELRALDTKAEIVPTNCSCSRPKVAAKSPGLFGGTTGNGRFWNSDR